jgi:hypothetical protein
VEQDWLRRTEDFADGVKAMAERRLPDFKAGERLSALGLGGAKAAAQRGQREPPTLPAPSKIPETTGMSGKIFSASKFFSYETIA